MKNGSRFSRLTLVEGSPDADASNGDDSAAYFPYRPEPASSAAGTSEGRMFVVMLTVSITCAAATVVTGGYAVWLARQQAARQALTDVNDILRSCQSRMSRLESDLQRLPNRQA